jgi:hypothetical protein
MAQRNFHPDTYGVMAEFSDPTELVHAAEKAYADGWRHLNCYSPFPIHGAWEAIGHKKSPMPLIVLLGGITGCLGIFGFITWANLIAYPLNIGGRPLFAWPAFIPPTFEATILLAGLSSAFGMFLVNGLPKPYHPVFNVPAFERASQDRYFLCLESSDQKFDRAATAEYLRGFNPEEVHEVEH